MYLGAHMQYWIILGLIIVIILLLMQSLSLFLVGKLFKLENNRFRTALIISFINIIVIVITSTILIVFKNYVESKLLHNLILWASLDAIITISIIFTGILILIVNYLLYKKLYLIKFIKSLFLFIISSILLIILVGIMLFVVKKYTFQPYIVDGVSMRPTLGNGSYLFINKIGKSFKRGDIIVYGLADENKNVLLANGVKTEVSLDSDFVGRIIAEPGDDFKINNGRILVNGIEVGSVANNISDNSFAYRDGYFVMGDNKDHSFDSRDFGFIYKNKIVGKIIPQLTFWLDSDVTAPTANDDLKRLEASKDTSNQVSKFPYTYKNQIDVSNKLIYSKENPDNLKLNDPAYSNIIGIYAKNLLLNTDTEIMRIGAKGSYPYQIVLDQNNKILYIDFESSIYSIDLINYTGKKIYALTQNEIDNKSRKITSIKLSPNGSKLAITKDNLTTGEDYFIQEFIIIDLLKNKSTVVFETQNNSGSKNEKRYDIYSWINNTNLLVLGDEPYIFDKIYNLGINSKILTSNNFETHLSDDYIFSHDKKSLVGSSVISPLDGSYGTCYEDGCCYYNGLIYSHDSIVEIILKDENYSFSPYLWSPDGSQIIYYKSSVDLEVFNERCMNQFLSDEKQYFVYDFKTKLSTAIDNLKNQINLWYPNYTSSVNDKFIMVNGSTPNLGKNDVYLGYIK
jgi:signal peptidase I